MDITFFYRLLAAVVAIGCAYEVLTSKKLTDQLTAGAVFIPLLLRALLIK